MIDLFIMRELLVYFAMIVMDNWLGVSRQHVLCMTNVVQIQKQCSKNKLIRTTGIWISDTLSMLGMPMPLSPIFMLCPS